MNELNESGQPDRDEEIIELTDIVTDGSKDSEEVVELSEIIDDDSADIAESPDAEGDEVEEAIVFDDELEDDFEDVADDEDDFADSLGMEIGDEEEGLDEEADFSEPDALEEDAGIQEPIAIPQEQMDEALERVIKNLYSDKIEGIIISAIEKAVTREIDKIKAALLED
ncbi:MAG: hypothetical protein GY868_21485 [Deltaproteobacteria bacterium]|nr:hypothetical protein [Deltaproteobacteria bacterium]